MRKLLIAFALSLGLHAADVTGTWIAQVETSAGSGSPTFVFKQEGEKITGTYSGALGDAKVAGTVKGDDIVFAFQVEPGGEKVEVTYKGKLEGSTKMKGTLVIPGLGEGTFTATRK
ncbi:MAG: hypothetical protein FJW40_04700 [Acidobacteria bacterium]|nr:hypothetical protein [Acidobacteriota bacterium]